MTQFHTATATASTPVGGLNSGLFEGAQREIRSLRDETIALTVEGLNLYYGDTPALKAVTMQVPTHRVTAFIGPSGCGKSTLLRCFNRMNDLIDSCRIEGSINLKGENIYARDADVAELRRRIGMVFQKPNPFPKSIFENVAYGLRMQGVKDKRILTEAVERSIKAVGLWDEVKDRLDSNAFGLSGGQQQRLVIARAIAIEPEVILLDEPTSALDPISTAKIEQLVEQLKEQYTILIVTHNMAQAARISDYTAYMYLGELIEYADTMHLFTNPSKKSTEDYITGRYG
ncbi:phosphate ABC transporter ATP-binding protein [Thiocapsa imhoffii]|uniref:Phosphate ABC transporter ATP-binding protein n=1 Tax=Thiocapsa imhoffii TaxID=382777 RepID=A0A9X0WLK4_9GAMM|nr:phosphate ABC transporter ATP-binding protein PstB [Thiocapsa imhoffii]MBK1646766.1 phosphate ABC transporter ATP-binding protein [Thiocapsa imhoffii]